MKKKRPVMGWSTQAQLALTVERKEMGLMVVLSPVPGSIAAARTGKIVGIDRGAFGLDHFERSEDIWSAMTACDCICDVAKARAMADL